jgi:hypothetical protein
MYMQQTENQQHVMVSFEPSSFICSPTRKRLNFNEMFMLLTSLHLRDEVPHILNFRTTCSHNINVPLQKLHLCSKSPDLLIMSRVICMK